jgi:hypothetical protein
MVACHEDCGEPVLLVDGEEFDLSGAEHRCRDYVAWHGPVDGRDPAFLDVAGGWRPGVDVARGGGVKQLDRVVPIGLNG